MDFLKWLAELRTPLGDWLMSAVTRLGEEALFIVLALTIFWCVDKKRGYFLLFTGFVGMVCNQLLKMIFRRGTGHVVFCAVGEYFQTCFVNHVPPPGCFSERTVPFFFNYTTFPS